MASLISPFHVHHWNEPWSLHTEQISVVELQPTSKSEFSLCFTAERDLEDEMKQMREEKKILARIRKPAKHSSQLLKASSIISYLILF